MLGIATSLAIMNYVEKTREVVGSEGFIKKTDAVVKSSLWSSVFGGAVKGWSEGKSLLGKVGGAIGGASKGYDEYKNSSSESGFIDGVKTY